MERLLVVVMGYEEGTRRPDRPSVDLSPRRQIRRRLAASHSVGTL
jgi:hypothetical protein